MQNNAKRVEIKDSWFNVKNTCGTKIIYSYPLCQKFTWKLQFTHITPCDFPWPICVGIIPAFTAFSNSWGGVETNSGYLSDFNKKNLWTDTNWTTCTNKISRCGSIRRNAKSLATDPEYWFVTFVSVHKVYLFLSTDEFNSWTASSIRAVQHILVTNVVNTCMLLRWRIWILSKYIWIWRKWHWDILSMDGIWALQSGI